MTLAVGATTVRIHIGDVVVGDAFDIAFSSLASEHEPAHEAMIAPSKNGYTLAIDPNRATLSITDPDGVSWMRRSLRASASAARVR